MYPIVSLQSAVTFLDERRRNDGETTHPPVVERRSQPEDAGLDVETIASRAVSELLVDFRHQKDDFDSQNDADSLEVRLIPDFYNTLCILPATVLSDADFWRYLAVATPLIEWVEWRDRNRKGPKPWPMMPADQSYGAHAQSLHRDTVPYRMFMRGNISAVAFEAGATTSPTELVEYAGSDFWKSHILRGLTSYSPTVVASAIRARQSGEISSARQVRDFFPHLRRLRTNILFDVLDSEAAAALVTRAAAATELEEPRD